MWYNGYKFYQDAPSVYNPVSLMKCFMNEEFKNYCFETGTPTFLLELLKDNPVDLDNLNVDENAFSTYDPVDLHPLHLLGQTGYLTLKSAEMIGDTRYYMLGYPNHEISQSFSYLLVRSMASVPDPELSGALRHMVKALQAGDVDTMLEHLKTFFHSVQYDLIEEKQKEKYYQTIFFTVFKLVGAMIDAVIRTTCHICIFEFKLNGSAEDAMAQIKDKQYAAPYRDDPRQVILVGVAFDWKGRNLGEWRIEPAFPNASPGEDNSKQVRERSPSYGLSEQEARVLSRAIQDYANACKGLDQAEANRQSFATKMIAEWAPFIERVWQSWTPAPHEVCAMLYLEEYPPSAFRHVVEDCINRSLRTEEVVGTRTYFRTELNGNPAENERAIFPVPLDVVHRQTSLIDIRWIDRNPGAPGTVPESS